MDQEVQVKHLEFEKQELKEQLELQQQKWQEANQKIQELQASQEERRTVSRRLRTWSRSCVCKSRMQLWRRARSLS